MAGSRGSVRIGPISLFALVVIICIAVMAVLAVSTARATYTLTQRQASATTDVYTNEAAAQRFVSLIDSQLNAGARSADDISSRIGQLADMVSSERTTVSASAAGTTVTAEFITDQSKFLDITLDVSGGTYQITSWKATTQWTEDEEAGTGLWQGNKAN